MRRFVISTVAVVCSLSLLSAQGGSAQVDAIALTNANVVNVRTGAIQRGATIVMRGGTIESIGSGVAPAGARAIDVRNRYVVPGLIDAHVHIFSLPQLRAALESGVTTARSAGVSNYVDVGMRELVRKGFVTGPEIIAAGQVTLAGAARQIRGFFATSCHCAGA